MIARILPILLILLIVPFFVIGIYAMRKKICGRRVFFGITINIILGIVLCALAYNEQYSHTIDLLKQTVMVACLFIIVPETIMSLFLLFGLLLGKNWGGKKYFYSSGIIALCVVVLLYYSFFIGPRQIVVRHTNVVDSSIPSAYDNYKIALISDLHLGTFRDDTSFIAKMVDKINQQNPDILIFAGDLVNYRASEAFPFIPTLQHIQSTDGAYAIKGNHDYLTYYKFSSDKEKQKEQASLERVIKQIGWTLLCNESVPLVRENDTITLAGLENSGKRKEFPQHAHLYKALPTNYEDHYTIVLSHDPSYWSDSIVEQTSVQLTLSGHTHAMQLQIGNWSPAKWFYREFNGLYKGAKGQQVFVTPGIGEVFIPFRFGALPTIDIITLHNPTN